MAEAFNILESKYMNISHNPEHRMHTPTVERDYINDNDYDNKDYIDDSGYDSENSITDDEFPHQNIDDILDHNAVPKIG